MAAGPTLGFGKLHGGRLALPPPRLHPGEAQVREEAALLALLLAVVPAGHQLIVELGLGLQLIML